jgi:hypothetical protein
MNLPKCGCVFKYKEKNMECFTRALKKMVGASSYIVCKLETRDKEYGTNILVATTRINMLIS